MAPAGWLIDKSALSWMNRSPRRDEWADRAIRGLVRICTPTLLELGFSAESPTDWETTMGREPVSLFPVEYLTPQAEKRAVEVQGLLAARGQHRAPSIPDLLIAAVAETSGLTVLHVDKDFELIAEITGQPVEELQVMA